jgi:NAD-dependent deacetylase
VDARLSAQLEQVAAIAARAANIAVLTGAGVSAESGIPTFRDAATGLWAKYDPVMLASYEGFKRDPATVWKWYDERRQSMRAAQPNPGHIALAQWEQAWRAAGREFTLITQNIDDLHGRAGSSGIIELHGNIWYVRPVDGAISDTRRLDECPLAQVPPLDAQGRMLRPHVVWFGEMLDPLTLQAAFEAVDGAQLVLVAGTSSVVYPAAALPYAAQRRGARVVEVNPNATDYSRRADFSLRANSGEALPELWRRVQALAGP